MPRQFMYEAVSSLPTVQASFGGRVMSVGAGEGPGGEDDRPTVPFIIIRSSTNQRGEGRVKQQRYQVWVHWSGGDTTPADNAVVELENVLPGKAGVSSPDGYIMDVRWEDTSGDGYDDHYGTNVRYVTFLATYSTA